MDKTLALPPDWYPESLAVGSAGMYVGSWRQGSVVLLPRHGGNPIMLIAPGANGLSNTQGLLVDEKRKRLWVCSGDLGYTTVPIHPSALLAFNLSTGEPIRRYEFPGGGYCNDLAMDRKGFIYVTDSRHPRVLRLTAEAAELEVWKDDVAFALDNNGFTVNGIAIEDQHIYVSAVAAVPYIFRLDVLANGDAGKVEKVEFSRPLKNADAIRSLGNGKLLIFESNAFGKEGAYGGQISLANLKTKELSILVTGLNDPSSGLVLDKRVYFIESKYSLLFRAKPDDTNTVPLKVPFDVQSIELHD
ncbi:MAG: hypothetical protein EOO53_12085 [Gammaproteobacteria bacterium]|nr:MAG: hypothetical protein EOO53_12085 [Gammaproteobacteria bacterium]